MEHKIKRVEKGVQVCRVVTDDNLKRKEIELDFLHKYFASADGRIWKRREIRAGQGERWIEVKQGKATARHKCQYVNIRDKKGKNRHISRAFLVLCAYRGYAGKWFYAGHTGDRTDDSIGNLRWKFRRSFTKRGKRKCITPSFFDILQGNDELMHEYLAKAARKSPAECRQWNEDLLKRYEQAVNGGKKFEI